MISEDYIGAAAAPGLSFPIRLLSKSGMTEKRNGDGFFCMPLLLAEARELIEELTAAIREVEDGSLVQVKYVCGSRPGNYHYTYRDPGLGLKVGDLVRVPVVSGEQIAVVTQLGRGSWKGPVKDVLSQLVEKHV
jgi:hypothetical protein